MSKWTNLEMDRLSWYWVVELQPALGGIKMVQLLLVTHNKEQLERTCHKLHPVLVTH